MYNTLKYSTNISDIITILFFMAMYIRHIKYYKCNIPKYYKCNIPKYYKGQYKILDITYYMDELKDEQPKQKPWKGKVGICEVCNSHVAEYNIDLTCGTHRECRWCWCSEYDYDFS